MFKNLAFMTQNNSFLRVSADTKTWAACPIRAVLRNKLVFSISYLVYNRLRPGRPALFIDHLLAVYVCLPASKGQANILIC
jgi:hypothetical protein